MELKGKRVMVIGLGVSGRAAARFLAARGARLVMTDLRKDCRAGRIAARAKCISAPKIRRGWRADFGDQVDLVVASPGVPPTLRLDDRGARPSHPDHRASSNWAAVLSSAPIIAITGTNGKSTVTVMIGEIFKAAGWNTFVGGNLGTPLVEAIGRQL